MPTELVKATPKELVKATLKELVKASLSMAVLDPHLGDSEEGLNRHGARDLQCPDSQGDGNTG